MEKTLAETIQEHPMFTDISPRHLGYLVDCAGLQEFRTGHHLFFEGEHANYCYLLLQGKVVLEMHAGNLGWVVIDTIEGGDIAGWSWMVPPYRWRFSAKCQEHTRAVAVDARCLRGKCEADAEFGYMLLKKLIVVTTSRLAATRMRLMEYIV